MARSIDKSYENDAKRTLIDLELHIIEPLKKSVSNLPCICSKPSKKAMLFLIRMLVVNC